MYWPVCPDHDDCCDDRPVCRECDSHVERGELRRCDLCGEAACASCRERRTVCWPCELRRVRPERLELHVAELMREHGAERVREIAAGRSRGAVRVRRGGPSPAAEGRRPEAIGCRHCGAAVTVARRGPVPAYCARCARLMHSLRHAAAELRRRRELGAAN